LPGENEERKETADPAKQPQNGQRRGYAKKTRGTKWGGDSIAQTLLAQESKKEPRPKRKKVNLVRRRESPDRKVRQVTFAPIVWSHTGQDNRP